MSIEQRAAGLPGLEDRLDELKIRLATNPYDVGTKWHYRNPRYHVTIDAGTLDWKVAIDYFIHEDRIELIQILV